jgi:hypothetical protein
MLCGRPRLSRDSVERFLDATASFDEASSASTLVVTDTFMSRAATVVCNIPR